MFSTHHDSRLSPVICGLEAELGRPVHRWHVTLLMRLQQALLYPHPNESNPAWAQTGVAMLPRIGTSSRSRSISASCDIRAAPTRVQRFAGSAERETIPRADLYSGYTLRSEIEAPLITREVLPETYFLLVIMPADAQAGPFLQFQASC